MPTTFFYINSEGKMIPEPVIVELDLEEINWVYEENGDPAIDTEE